MQTDLHEQARGYAAAHARKRKWRVLIAVLCCAVAASTAYALTRPAITMEEQTFCGLQEHTHDANCYETTLICGMDETLPDERPEAHTHTEDCYELRQTLICPLEEDETHVHTEDCYETQAVLICPLEEGAQDGEPAAPEHTHTEACYQTQLVCTLPEHQHSLACYADAQADLEDASVWERTLPQPLSGELRADVVAVAESQLGYAASTRNYIVDENGGMHGYTRYGAWYGSPYGEWCAMFASFCLHYAGVPQTEIAPEAGCIRWVEQLQEAGRYAAAGAYTPQPGDLIFFDTNSDGYADHVGIVAEAPDGAALTTIEGNVGGCVVRRHHEQDTSGVLGYGVLPEPADETPDTPDEPEEPEEPAKTPVCGLEEHTHTAECYDADGNLICEKPEHTHVDSCYAQDEEKTPVCGLEEHAHTADCYDEDGNLICEKPEHTHVDSCYAQDEEKTPVCGLEEHTHTAECYDADGNLICEKPEHTHVDSCYLPQEHSTQQFTYEDTQLQLTLTVESAQPLPEGTELDVQPLDASLFADEDAEADGMQQWIVRQLALTQDGEALDTTGYSMTAEITVAEQVLAPLREQAADAEDAAPEAETGVTLAVMQASDEEGLQELSSATIGAAEQAPVLTVSVQSGTIAVLATTANPHYTVQYYAYIPRFATSGDKALTVYDTNGAILPKNKQSNATKEIHLKETGANTDKNAGEKTPYYEVATATELTQMYSDNQFEYIKAPNPSYINKLLDNTNYTLQSLWVLKDGCSKDSTDEADWDVYDNPDTVHFTNRKEVQDQGSTSGQQIVYLAEGSTIRLVYNAANDSFTTPATFYDYDISSGQNADGRWRTGTTGINVEKNYGTSQNGKRKWDSYCDVLAFGNDNCGTGMSRYKFDGVFLNKYSTTYTTSGSSTPTPLPGTVDEFGCTFGLAKSLNTETNTIVYNDWLVAPKLFNDGSAEGKHPYENSSLTFSQVGDTYTLSSATVSGVGSISGLDLFFNPSPYKDKTHAHIFTNDFWPLDRATNRTDPNFGQYGNSVYYQGFKPYGKVDYDGTVLSGGNWNDEQGSLPVSDDGNAHNSFFGMQYAVEFTLTPDYVGPLDYTFFGDDDMWVFLDSTLVCDIGGVHSSVGEYVNLWDYLKKDGREKDETHTLTFFYTERGASGSTCYMNFTLPSVSGVNIEQKTADLRVSKEVIGDDSSDRAFEFTVRFSDQSGNTIWDDYAYTRYDKNGNELESDLVLHEGSTFHLKAGEYVIIKYLPIGLRYTITETNTTGYDVTNTVNGVVSAGDTAQGTIIKDTLATAVFTNTMHKVGLTLQKLDQDGHALTGATFELKNASDQSDQTVYAVKTEANGSYTYTVPSSGATQIQSGELYYIVSAVDQNFVIGQDTSATDKDAKLQEKTGADTQKMLVVRQSDGSYSFRCKANNLYLDLDSANLENGHLVHFYQGADGNIDTPHENQKWYLIANGDGTFKIKPRVAVLNKSTAVLDLNEANVIEGQKIQVWTDNNTGAQKWLLVPVNPTETPTTTSELAVGTDGILRLAGLLPGTYTLTETAAPNGYQKLTQPIKFHVDASGKVTLAENTATEVTVDSGSNAYVLQVKNRHDDVKLTLKKELQNSSTTQEFTFTVSYPDPADPNASIEKTLQLSGGGSEMLKDIPYGVEVTITETGHDGFTVSFKDGNGAVVQGDSYTFKITSDVTITAVNAAGYALPSTGGGALWYQLAGSMLLAMLAAYTAYNWIKTKKQKEKGTTRL